MNLINKKQYNVLNEVSELVGRQLEVMEALGEARKYRMDVRSRLICRCPRCIAEAENTMAWIESMREAPATEPAAVPAKQAAPKLQRRIFGEL